VTTPDPLAVRAAALIRETGAVDEVEAMIVHRLAEASRAVDEAPIDPEVRAALRRWPWRRRGGKPSDHPGQAAGPTTAGRRGAVGMIGAEGGSRHPASTLADRRSPGPAVTRSWEATWSRRAEVPSGGLAEASLPGADASPRWALDR